MKGDKLLQVGSYRYISNSRGKHIAAVESKIDASYAISFVFTFVTEASDSKEELRHNLHTLIDALFLDIVEKC